MAKFLVVFRDKGNCDITDVTVVCNNIVFAACEARHKILIRDGEGKSKELDRDTDSIRVEKLT